MFNPQSSVKCGGVGGGVLLGDQAMEMNTNDGLC